MNLNSQTESPGLRAYLRLGGEGFDSSKVAAAAGCSLAFVDLGSASSSILARAEDALTDIAPSLVHLSTLIFRWPKVALLKESVTDEALADREVLEWLDRLRARRLQLFGEVTLGAVRFRVGQPARPIRIGSRAAEMSDATILDQCRGAELSALAAAGDAVWRPRSYHFRLPGGQHATTFVRLADAIRSPRDAVVLASWLANSIEDYFGILADSPTITPVVTELHALATKAGYEPGPVVFLQDYPRTRLGVIEAARRSMGLAGHISAILSVNSSGRVLELMADSLESVAPGGWTLDVLVDKRHARTNRAMSPNVRWWLTLDDELAAADPTSPCPWCRDHSRARVVFIDPRSFEPFLLPRPSLQVADSEDAHRNRSLFQLTTQQDAIAVECLPSAQGGPRGRRERMGVRFLYDHLAADLSLLGTAIESRVGAISRASSGPDLALASRLAAFAEVDLVVVSWGDAVRPDGRDVRDRVALVLRSINVNAEHVLPIDIRRGVEELSTADSVALAHSRQPLVFAFGSVTGWTLRRLRDTVRAHTAPAVRPRGLVVHSRPQSRREWSAIEAMFDGSCAYIWQTFLPWESPLREEAVLLNEFAQHVADGSVKLATEAASFLEMRQAIADPSDSVASWDTRLERFARGDLGVHPTSVLWGISEPKARADHGVFGRQLDPITTYVAVGSALHHSRMEALEADGPFWHAYDLRDAVRLRYDAVTMACLLRWLMPAETWWGDTAAEARQTARLIVSFMQESESELAVFIPEVLLATAMGKVHPSAVEVFLEWGNMAGHSVPAGNEGAVSLAQALISWSRPTGLQ
jgi:hypothetical protein